MTPPGILVIGGTRGTGMRIARILHERGRGVRVLARDPDRARASFDAAVEVVRGDLTQPETLEPAFEGVGGVVFTAGSRSGVPVGEAQIRAVEYEGMVHTLAAARRAGFAGRLLYMTASGITRTSLWSFLLNRVKGNTLQWRRRVEEAIRESGVDYTVLRAGVLLDRPGGRHEIRITQRPLPLSPRYRIARDDVAELFVAAIDHPRASRATFEAVWGRAGDPGPWSALLDGLQPDAPEGGAGRNP